MDKANPGPAWLRALAADRGLRRNLGRSLRARLAGGGGDGGIDGLDTAALRMTFPSRLRIRLRDGSTRVVEGTRARLLRAPARRAARRRRGAPRGRRGGITVRASRSRLAAPLPLYAKTFAALALSA